MTKEKIQSAVYTHRFVYNFHYHLIWVTKYRHQTFSTKELVDEMKDILRMVAKDNKLYWGGHLWPHSYYMSTLGNMSKDVVENYINNQKYNTLQKKKCPNGR